MSQKEKVLELLKNIQPFPTQDRDNIVNIPKGKTEATFRANNQGFILGKVKDFGTKREDQVIKGKDNIITAKRTNTPKYKELFVEASKLMKSHNPNFKFTSIQFNKNQKTKKHKDGNNVGKTYIIGLGDYSGGDVRLYAPDGKSYKDINIKNRWATFDGSELEHETTPFKGDRYSLVFYNVN